MPCLVFENSVFFRLLETDFLRDWGLNKNFAPTLNIPTILRIGINISDISSCQNRAHNILKCPEPAEKASASIFHPCNTMGIFTWYFNENKMTDCPGRTFCSASLQKHSALPHPYWLLMTRCIDSIVQQSQWVRPAILRKMNQYTVEKSH